MKKYLLTFIRRGRALGQKLAQKIWLQEAKIAGLIHGESLVLNGRPLIRVHPGSCIRFGDGVTINSAFESNQLGLPARTVIRTLSENASIRLGSHVGISGATLCAGCGIVIGDGVLIGAGALIIDNDFHSWDGVKWVGDTISGSKAIYVHDYVFIGARAIILKGVTLGTGAVVGAGAVVAKDVAPFTIVGGNPARVIGRRS